MSKKLVLYQLPQQETYDASDPDAQLKKDMWSVCHECWKKKGDRPSMEEVHHGLIKVFYRHGGAIGYVGGAPQK